MKALLKIHSAVGAIKALSELDAFYEQHVDISKNGTFFLNMLVRFDPVRAFLIDQPSESWKDNQELKAAYLSSLAILERSFEDYKNRLWKN